MLLFSSAIFLFLLAFITGCTKQSSNAVPAVSVEVATVITKDVPVYSEWTASTDGCTNVAVRAQVQGYLISQRYHEGDLVKKGRVLFEIDPRPFITSLEQAEAKLAEARNRWQNARTHLDRVRPLAEQHAVSTRVLDEATSSEGALRASLEAAKAAKKKAEIDLGFTTIASPINGIAGMAKVQVGNLVGPGSTEALTTVSTVDPIKVNIPMAEQEYLRDMRNGKNGKAVLELILADGSIHPHKGKFAFVDRQVDVGTGTINVAALFPNPGNFLRPGQFARVRARTSVLKNAPLVPQRAVIEVQGSHEVAVVNKGNRIEMTPVRVGRRVDDLWVIEDGLKAGQKVVVEGLQKVRNGSPVTVRSCQQPPRAEKPRK
jgi:membrane fusion protein (multidrug efflux system)